MSTEKPSIKYPKPLHKTLFVMFSGKAGVGKTYWRDAILSDLVHSGYKAKSVSFARGVKDTALTRFGWNGAKDDLGRQLLQDIGRIGRAYNQNIWVEQTMDGISVDVGFPFDVVLVDDWRFINEHAYVRDCELLYKPITVRIEAPERELLRGTPQYDDESETNLDSFPFDLRVDNPVHGENLARDKIKNILELNGIEW